MAAIEAARDRVRANPRAVTAALSVVGYALVIGAFAGLQFPRLPDDTVLLFGDLIAVVNTVALLALLAGYRFIRRGEVRRHKRAMLAAFGLILLFLVLYLLKVGGGFTKEISPATPALAEYAYLAMLAVHVLLSIVSVPVVLHAVVLGLTHTPEELRDSLHPRVGRIAVAAWSLSLFLGVVTYLLLNHVYGWVRAEEAVLLLALARPRPPD
jgi:putative membrane protein